MKKVSLFVLMMMVLLLGAVPSSYADSHVVVRGGVWIGAPVWWGPGWG